MENDRFRYCRLVCVAEHRFPVSPRTARGGTTPQNGGVVRNRYLTHDITSKERP